MKNKKEMLTETLEYIFDNTNNWLKFAESKNGALMVLNSGLIFGYLSMLPYSLSDIPTPILIFSINFVAFNIIGLFIGLISFIPKYHLNIHSNHKSENLDFNFNPLFWGDLVSLSPELLISKLCSELEVETNQSPFHISLAQQIITNSVIAKRKFDLFRYAIFATLSSIFSPIIGLLIYYVLSKKG